MKHSFVTLMLGVVAALGFGASSVLAKGNGNSSNSSAPAPHHAAATTTVAPHLNGGTHYSSAMPYRATVSYRSGTRTLNYPAVGVSTLRHPTGSGGANFNNAYALQHSGNSQHLSGNNTGGKTHLDSQTSSRLRNWNGNVASTSQARLNHLNNCNHHHGSNWWRNRCVAIIFFDFGWWGWYDGWWYPAWGYDPYSYYEYNEPIYGADGLSPDQIVASVQVALQQQGYYTWAVDGKIGPLTRSAIARYQRDHRLPITSGIDPATLGALGVLR